MKPKPMVTTHDGGLKFTTDIRGHKVEVDQPKDAGGDEAPTPLELMGASIGACVALYVQQFCQARGLKYEGMRVEVGMRGAQAPSRVGQFDVRVVLQDEIPEQYAEMLERVARSCPAHNTLVHGSDVAVRVEQEVPAGV